jgi:hypothetical protein
MNFRICGTLKGGLAPEVLGNVRDVDPPAGDLEQPLVQPVDVIKDMTEGRLDDLRLGDKIDHRLLHPSQGTIEEERLKIPHPEDPVARRSRDHPPECPKIMVVGIRPAVAVDLLDGLHGSERVVGELIVRTRAVFDLCAAQPPFVGERIVRMVQERPGRSDRDKAVDVQPDVEFLYRRAAEFPLQPIGHLIGCPVVRRDPVRPFPGKEGEPPFTRGHFIRGISFHSLKYTPFHLKKVARERG